MGNSLVFKILSQKKLLKKENHLENISYFSYFKSDQFYAKNVSKLQ